MARVTVYDVAEKAGVSTATVSFAFRHPDKVKDDTKAKVLRVAEELGYVPSGNARSLAKGRTGTLGMYAFDMLLERPQGSNLEDDWPDVSPRSIDEPLDGDEPNVLVYPLYVDEVLRGFELECWKSGKGILMGAASERDDHRSVTDIAGRVDGLALMPSGYNEVHHINDMAFVGGVNGGACARGTDADDVVSRYDAFKKCLEERGLDSSDALLDDSFATSDEYMVGLCEAIGSGRLPQALVCGTDQTAFGVIRLLEEAGVRVPDDVIVTGFDGILAGRLMEPQLTTVRQPMEDMGREAARMLLVRCSCGCNQKI